MILTDEEVKRFKGMSNYWKEVRGRDDRSPLIDEATQVRSILGVRILALVEEYIELKEQKD